MGFLASNGPDVSAFPLTGATSQSEVFFSRPGDRNEQAFVDHGGWCQRRHTGKQDLHVSKSEEAAMWSSKTSDAHACLRRRTSSDLCPLPTAISEWCRKEGANSTCHLQRQDAALLGTGIYPLAAPVVSNLETSCFWYEFIALV